MAKISYNHLTIDQRNLIEHLLNKGKNFSSIGKTLKLDRTTISKEIRRNYFVKVPTYSKTPCENQSTCGVGFCKYNKQCYKAKECIILSKPPYVCNSCDNKAYCKFTKHFYFANEAQKLYDKRNIESKKGYDISLEDIDLIEKIIVPLIKTKKQPINHIYANHKDILFFSEPTFYRYVNDGVLSLANIDLPKKVTYKPRANSEHIKEKKKKAYLKGRNFDEFLDYLAKNPNKSVVEMDIVEGIKGGKCFLTLFIRKTSLLLIFLLDSKTQSEVNKCFLFLKEKLGLPLFKKIFQIILTDNGSEFLNPIIFERDLETGKKISRVFYCDPYSSWQKYLIENAHKRIRIVLPKETSFNNLTDEQVKILRDNIANLYKDKIKSTPYKETEKIFPELIKKLDISYISPDEVNLSDSIMKGVDFHE